MYAHRVEVTLTENGSLTLNGLPFHAGQAVEVIIVERPSPVPLQDPGSLRGSVIRYDSPTDPVAQQDWEAIR